jgi:hypothetical protein
MADGFIQVPADSVGKKVDTEEVTRTDGTLVEQQRVQVVNSTVESLLTQLIVEVRELKWALISALH